MREREKTTNDLHASFSVQLLELADDFDRLSDDARDDCMFIYEWIPPKWFEVQYRDPKSDERLLSEDPVVIAAMLREVAGFLAGKAER